MEGLVSLGASLSIGFAALGVALGQCYFIYKVLEILGKNPKMSPYFLTLAILGIALVESSAIYGLIVSLQLVGQEFVNPLASIGAGLAIGLTGFGVGVGQGMIVKDGADAANKNPDDKNKIMSFMVLFIALVESSVIYGLVISLRIISDLEIGSMVSIGGGLAIGLAGIGASLGMAMISKTTLESVGENGVGNKMLIPITILGIALVEAVAIYGLIISLNILSLSADKGFLAIGSALSIGLTGLGVTIGQGMLISKTIKRMSLPWVSAKSLIPIMVLGVALIESSAIYGLVVSFQLLGAGVELGLTAIGAGLAVGLTGLGVGLGQGMIATKAVEAMTVNGAAKSKLTTFMVLFIAIIESVVIYGLIIAVQLIAKTNDIGVASIGSALSIGLAGLGVAVGGSFLSGRGVELIGKRQELSGFFVTTSILGLALIESAAIYGLIISFNTMGKPELAYNALGGGLSMGLAGLGVGLALGYLMSGAFSAMARNPKERTKYLTFMILFAALVEVLAIYGLIIAFQLTNK